MERRADKAASKRQIGWAEFLSPKQHERNKREQKKRSGRKPGLLGTAQLNVKKKKKMEKGQGRLPEYILHARCVNFRTKRQLVPGARPP